MTGHIVLGESTPAGRRARVVVAALAVLMDSAAVILVAIGTVVFADLIGVGTHHPRA